MVHSDKKSPVWPFDPFILRGNVGFNVREHATYSLHLGASVAKYWLEAMPYNHLPLATVASNLSRDFGFFM